MKCLVTSKSTLFPLIIKIAGLFSSFWCIFLNICLTRELRIKSSLYQNNLCTRNISTAKTAFWNQYGQEYRWNVIFQTPFRTDFLTSTLESRVAAGSETKGGREGKKSTICWRKRVGKQKNWERLLSEGHFGCHLSPWRRGPGPQKPLGRADCLRGARYFLQHHLSLSPHNDSPRSSLLMFVIALSHKGGDDQWSREEHEGVRRCRIAVCPFNASRLSLSAASPASTALLWVSFFLMLWWEEKQDSEREANSWFHLFNPCTSAEMQKCRENTGWKKIITFKFKKEPNISGGGYYAEWFFFATLEVWVYMG